MTHLSATAARQRQRRRYVVPVIAVVTVAMLGAVMTLAASTPQAQAQLNNTTCYTINDGPGTMTSWTGATETVVGATGLSGVESLSANQDRNELWSYDDTTQSVYSFTVGSSTPTLEFAFTAAGAGGIDGLTWVNHADGDPTNDQLWGTFRNGANDSPNVADQIARIDPATGAIIGSVLTLQDPGAGSDELDDNDGLIWDPQTTNLYGVIGGDTTANDLTIIDPATGLVSQINLTLNGNDIYDIESLGASTAGQLYGTTGEDAGPNPPGNTDQNQFVSIDKLTGVVTVIGQFTPSGGTNTNVDYEATACLTVVPFSVVPSVCYAIDEGNGADDNHLVQVDIAADGSFTFTDRGVINNGATPPVAARNIESVAYRNGFEPRALYTQDPATDSLIRINIADGTDTVLVVDPQVDIGDIDGLTWRNDNDADPSNDELWGIVRRTGTPNLEDQIVQINPLTGVIIGTPVVVQTNGSGSENDVDGLAWDPATDTFYAPVNGSGSINNLITINPADGAITVIGSTGVEDIEGIGFTDAGELFGMTGGDGATPNEFLFINKFSGLATPLGAIALYTDYESLDCAGIAPVNPPTFDIITTIIRDGETCPVDYTAALAAGKDGLDTIEVAAPGDELVKYCFDIINTGPGDAQNVVISSPALAAPIAIGDLAVGAEAMGMTVVAAANTQGTTTDGFVDGTDTQGNAVAQAEDNSGYVIVDAPVLEILTTIIRDGETCPATYADALAIVGNPGLDTIEVATPGDELVKYCFDITNSGSGDAINVVISSPALGADITIGNLAAGADAMGMTLVAAANLQGTTTDGFVNGEDTLGNAVPEDEDPAGYVIVDAPVLEILTTIIRDGETCPATYADALAIVGNPGLDTIEVAAPGDELVKYCFDITNSGSGDAANVVISSPALGADITIGNLAAGADAMGMTTVAAANTQGTTTDGFVNGTDTLGNAVPEDEDPAGYVLVQPPVLEILTTIIRDGETCPATYADALAIVGNPGLDTIEVATPGDELVKYCFDITNSGSGDAINVVISSPALGADITIGNLAAGADAMGMTLVAAANLQGTTTDGFVNGEDTLGNAVPEDEDPAGYVIVDAPVLEILTTIIRDGETCPATYADALAIVGNPGLDTIEVAAPGDELVKYCFDITNSGSGDAINVVISSPALGADITIGNLAMGADAMGMTTVAAANTQGTTTDGFVNGEDTLGNAVPEDEDPAGYVLVPPPVLEILTTIIRDGETCPATYADALAIVGNPGLDTIEVAAPGDELVKYCFDITNSGSGDAINVVISSPALGADITIGNLAAGADAMGMTLVAAANLQGTTTDGFVDGEDTLGNAVPQDEDPAGYVIVEPPVLDIRLTVINPDDPATPTCPADFASGIEGDGPALDIFVGDNVKFCFNVINTGAGDAQNVVVTYPFPGGATFNLGTIAASGGEAMGMTTPAPFQSGDPVQTTAAVDGEDTLGNAVAQAEDPALINPTEPIASIGDLVWRDNNRDGIQDGVGEPGIENVLVTVWSVNPDGSLNAEVGNDTTDAFGDWGLDVPPGTYRVFFELPVGAESFSPLDQGGDDALDSDVTPTGANAGWTGDYTVANGDSNQTIDAGVSYPVLQARLGNFVWEDTNNNGIQETGELGIGDISVQVTDVATGLVIGSTMTIADGSWVLPVDPGTYTVQFINSTTGVFTQPNIGDDALDSDAAADGTTGQYTVAEDEENFTIDAGIYFPSPAIGLAKALTGGPTRIGQTDNYDFTYTFIIENIGELDLTAVTLTDNVAVGLAAASATASVVSGPTANGGTCSAAVLAGTQALAVGESCTAVWDFVIANPGGTALAFNNSATVVGTPPTGPDVTDISDDGALVDPDGNGNANEPGENDPTPASIPPLPPVLEILTTIIRSGETCPATYADALAVAGNPGLDTIQVAAPGTEDVKYCFDVINNGDGPAQNVVITSPALAADITIGDLAVGAEGMGMTALAPATSQPTTTVGTVNGEDLLGTAVAEDTDPSGYEVVDAPILEILTTIIRSGETCPATYADALAVAGNPGLDEIQVAAPGTEDVKYCFDVINNGSGAAQNVVITSPALTAPVTIGDLAAGAEGMGMTALAPATSQPTTTVGAVNGEDLLGTAVAEDTDPSGYEIVEAPVLEILTTIIRSGETCPATYADALAVAGNPGLDEIQVAAPGTEDVKYCFDVINNGPGAAQNVVITSPALAADITIGDLAAGAEGMGMTALAPATSQPTTTVGTVNGEDLLGTAVAEDTDPSGYEVIEAPVLEILTTIIRSGETCPATYADALAVVGNPGLDEIQVAAPGTEDVKYCFDVINNGPGAAQNVVITSPALAADITIGDLAAGAEGMGMTALAPATSQPTTTVGTVNGEDLLGTAVAEDTDPSGYEIVEAPVLEILTTIIRSGETCPATYADALAIVGNPGLDEIQVAAPGTEDVKYCFDVINNGPGAAQNVVITSPALAADITIGDLAAGAEGMGMTALAPATSQPTTTVGTVNGEDLLGTAVAEDTDPSGYEVIEAPVLEILTTIIRSGETCPATYADALAIVGNPGLDTIQVAAPGTEDVKYCFDVINNGPGAAQNVVITSPALAADITIGDLAVGAEGMGMTALAPATSQPTTTVGTVNGEDTLGNAVPDDTDPSGYIIENAPTLEILTTIIRSGETCPATYADALAIVGNPGLDEIQVAAPGTEDVKYCFDVINNGPGAAQNVVITSPALAADITIGDLAVGAEGMGMTALAPATSQPTSTLGTVSGEDVLGNAVPDATDPSGYQVIEAPVLEILTTIIRSGETCPATYADALAIVGNPGLDEIQVAAPGTEDVKYCFDVINNGPGAAQNVVITSPALTAPVTIGDLAVGAEGMGMTDLAPATSQPTTTVGAVNGEDLLGTAVAEDTDPSGYEIVEAPVLEILTTIIRSGETCPATYADALAVAGNPGLDEIQVAAPGTEDVKYCFDVINNGPGAAQNVVINSPALAAPVTIGDLAVGAEGMGMTALAPATSQPISTLGTVSGEDTLGNAVPDDTDPSGYEIVEAPVLEILTTIIRSGETCPATYAAALAVAGNPGLDEIQVAAPGTEDVKYCFDVINNGPGAAQNVVITSPALTAPVTIGDLAVGAEGMGMTALAPATSQPTTTVGTVSGEDILGTAVAEDTDPAGYEVVDAPILEILTTIIRSGETCPATYADALAVVGNPGLDEIQVAAPGTEDVKYCFDVINNGSGAAQNVVINSPALTAPVTIGDLAVGAEGMGMTALAPATSQPTTTVGTVSGEDTLGTAVPEDTDPAGYEIVEAPVLEILTTIIREGETCPATYADALAIAGNPGRDEIQVAAPGAALVKYCFDVINNGPGAAQNVVINSPALAAPVTIGDLAVGAEGMGMTALAPATSQPTTTVGTVAGEDLLGTAVPEDTDPAGYVVVEAPVLDIVTTIIREGETCPADYAAAVVAGDGLDTIQVAAPGTENVKYCFDVINNGPGAASNVVISSLALAADVTIGDLAVGAEGMGMSALAPATSQPTTTDGFVNGEDILGNAVPQAEDPSGYIIEDAPTLEIVTTIIREGETCPATYAAALAVGDGLDTIQVAAPGDELVKYCFDIINNGPGAAANVVISSPALAADITIGDLAVGAEGMGMTALAAATSQPTTTVGTVAGEDILGNPVPDATDPSGYVIVEAPVLDIVTTIIREGETCPATYAAALAIAGNPGLDTIQVAAPGTENVKYCFDVINNGPGAASNVVISSLALAADVTIGDLAVGAEGMGMSALAAATSQPTTTDGFVNGEDILGNAVPQAEDPSGYIIEDAPTLEIVTTIIREGETCPADYAAAVIAGDGLDTIQVAAPGDELVKYCFDIINNGPGAATNVVISSPALAADITIGDLAVGAEGMGMTALAAATSQPTETLGTVAGEDILGNPVPDATDPSGYVIVEAPVLDIVTTIIREGETCPADYAAAVVAGDGLDTIQVAAPGTELVKYCFDVINNGPGAATNVEIVSTITGPITIGDLAAGAEAMGMTDLAPANGQSTQSLGSVSGQDTLGNDVPGATDPAGYEIVDAPILEIVTTVIREGETCPATYAAALAAGGGLDTIQVAAPGTENVKYCFDVINVGSGAASNVVISSPALAADITIGDLAVNGEGMGMTDLAPATSQPTETLGTASGTDTLSNPVPDATDPSGYEIVEAPVLDVVTTIIREGETCPATYAEAVAAGDGLDTIQVAAPGSDLVKYCFDVINNGPGAAINVVISSPALAADITIGDLAVGAEGMGMTDLAPATSEPTETVGTVSGADILGNVAPDATDPSGYEVVDAPILEIVTTIIREGETCPATYAAALAAGAGLDTVEVITPGDALVKYCFDVINVGSGVASNVVITSPALAAPITIGDIAVDGEAMGMTDLAPANSQPTVTVGTVSGEDTLGNAVPAATDPAGYEIAPIPVIGLAKALTDGPTLNADGTHTIQYSFVIENLGPVALTAVGITDDFAAVFTPATVAGPTPIGGTCDSAAAAAGTAALAVGESCTAVWTVVVTGAVPGAVYDNTATATGTAADGQIATDISDDGTVTDPNGNGDPGDPDEDTPTPATIPPAEKAIIGNFVFRDGNADGIQGAAEAGVANVEVEVRTPDSTLVERTTTNANGLWTATVDAGDYVVSFTTPAGHVFSPQDQGANDATDSDVDITSGLTGTYSVVAGETNNTIDAGLVPLGSLGNRVYLDTNGNGIQDPGEPSVAGATVRLFKANADGTKGELVGTQVTPADGTYNFENLVAGGYIVVVTPPAGFVAGPQNLDADDDVNNDISPTTGESRVIFVGVGEALVNVDAGLVAAPSTPTPPPTTPGSPQLPLPNITNAPPSPRAAVAPVPPVPPLAVTGSSSNVLATLAIAMMAVGGTMFIGARREGDKE